MVQTILPLSEKIAPLLMPDLTSLRLTEAEFEQLCRDNPELRLELTSTGGLIVMPPAGSKTGQRNSNLNRQVGVWAHKDGTGLAFDSSTGFTLPNRAIRSPDASWVRRDAWNALSEAEQERFAPLCPDFVIELRSSSDSLRTLKQKMQEYLDNGTRLAWLIDPHDRSVYIYRSGKEVESLKDAETISADPILRGFVLQLAELW